MKPLRATDPPAVGEFTLLGRLGAGGMGVVYLGVTRSGRPVAVKVIGPEIAADPAFRARFVREVAAARQVGGFWTASVVAADPAADRPWLATEYVPGPSLQQAVAAAGPLPAGPVRIVAARLAEALAAIHAAGLVHRDLKPANVLLAPDGPMVIDFGITRAFATGTAGHTAVIGTPGYMAPEQIRGRPLSPATDVFALGGTVVFALLGRGPFHTGPPEGIIFRVVAEPPDLTGVPDGLRELVAGCLAKDPAARPSTGQLLDRLRPAAGGLVTPYGGWQPPPHDPAAALATPVRLPATGRARVAAPAPAAAAPAPSPAPAPAPSPAPAAAAPAPAPVGAPAAPGPPPPPVPGPGGDRPSPLVARYLQPGESLHGQWRQHRAGLLPAVAGGASATALLGLLAGYALWYLHAAWFATIPVVLAVAVLGWLGWQLLAWRLSRFALTDQRVLLVQWGLLSRRAAALPLARVAGVRVRRSPAGRFLGYGTLRFESTGGGPAPELPEVRYLPEPDQLHRRVGAARAGLR